MRVHCLQHVAFQGLASIAPWLADHGAQVAGTRLHEGQSLPRWGDFDWLIVMGGPMSVHDESAYPWLVAERRFIADAIARDKASLGICLGAQLIASTLGADVYPNTEYEIGWFPVERVEDGPPTELHALLRQEFEAFHWHGETFDVPTGAVHLARSEACDNQAFAFGNRVLGLQFHLETTPAAATALIKHCADEVVQGRYVQDADSVLSRIDRFAQANGAMAKVLEHMQQRAI